MKWGRAFFDFWSLEKKGGGVGETKNPFSTNGGRKRTLLRRIAWSGYIAINSLISLSTPNCMAFQLFPGADSLIRCCDTELQRLREASFAIPLKWVTNAESLDFWHFFQLELTLKLVVECRWVCYRSYRIVAGLRLFRCRSRLLRNQLLGLCAVVSKSIFLREKFWCGSPVIPQLAYPALWFTRFIFVPHSRGPAWCLLPLSYG